MTETRKDLPVLAFDGAAALEAWLEAHAAAVAGSEVGDHRGIWLKLAKAGSGVASVSRQEAIDAGLSFGWIDGLVNAYDAAFYLLRFTPRRSRSKWSLINAERAEALMAEGRVRPGGMLQIEAAKADGRWDAAYPPPSRIEAPDDLTEALAANPKAKAFFETLKGSNRYGVLYRLHQVQKPDKRAAAIDKWVAMLERGETLY